MIKKLTYTIAATGFAALMSTGCDCWDKSSPASYLPPIESTSRDDDFNKKMADLYERAAEVSKGIDKTREEYQQGQAQNEDILNRLREASEEEERVDVKRRRPKVTKEKETSIFERSNLRDPIEGI
ncbi:MAG: hypothetical protein ABIB71_01480 [Candidatus Woesearchaeota archaeon]